MDPRALKPSHAVEQLRGLIIAIVRLKELGCASDLTSALVTGGIGAIEFPLTQPDALLAIRSVRDRFPNLLVGAGSVLTVDDAKKSIDAGAKFVVAPVADLPTIAFCVQQGIPVIPGALSPTEILAAHNAGASAVKIFPARNLGRSYIKDILEPMPFLRLVPTGGVTAENAKAYFQAGAFALGVGGSILDHDAIARRDWEAVTNGARRFMQSIN